MRVENKMAPEFLICAPMQCAGSSNGILGAVQMAKVIEKFGRKAFMCQIIGANDEGIYTGDLAKFVPVTDFERYWTELALNNAATYNVEFLTDFSRARIESAYVIYPESVLGNPLNAPNVIRFFGNRDGILKSGAKVRRGSNDFLVGHSRVMTPEADHFCTFTWMNPLFHRRGTQPARQRSLDLTYVGKGSLYGFNGTVSNTVLITRYCPGSKEELAILLRQCRFFYTADACSHINNEALSCGAIPVFMHYGPWTDVEISAFEAGALPRLHMGQTLGEAEFQQFEADRERYLAGLDAMAQRWERSVGELIEKVDQHFQSSPAGRGAAAVVPPKLSRKERKRWQKLESSATKAISLP